MNPQWSFLLSFAFFQLKFRSEVTAVKSSSVGGLAPASSQQQKPDKCNSRRGTIGPFLRFCLFLSAEDPVMGRVTMLVRLTPPAMSLDCDHAGAPTHIGAKETHRWGGRRPSLPCPLLVPTTWKLRRRRPALHQLPLRCVQSEALTATCISATYKVQTTLSLSRLELSVCQTALVDPSSI